MDLPDFQNLNQRDFSHLSVDALPGVNSDDSGDYDRKQDDYYSVLNIPRNASQDDIKAAYKRLSMIYHPDRLTGKLSDDDLEHAKVRFSQINSAYQVLSDERTRSVYDVAGADGLQELMQVGFPLRSTEEIRAEFSRIKYENERQAVEDVLKSSPTQLELNVDLKPIFDEGALNYYLNDIKIIQANQITIDPSAEIDISGVIVSRKIGGIGYLVTSARKSTTVGTFASSIAFGTASFANIEFSSRFMNRGDFSVKTIFPEFPLNLNPRFQTSFGYPLGRKTYGSITYTSSQLQLLSGNGSERYEPDDSVEISIQNVNASDRIEYSGEFGPQSISGKMKYSHRLEKQTSLFSEVEVSGESGLSISFGSKVNVIPNYRISTAVKMSNLGLVMVSPEFTRYSWSIRVPLVLSEHGSWKALLFSAGLLAFTFFGGRSLSTFYRRKILSDSYYASKGNSKRDLNVMKAQYDRKVESEQSVDGLIVVDALYGSFDIDSPKLDVLCIDVKIQLQIAVHDSKLTLAPGTKCKLFGFWDPCPGMTKYLFIEYIYRGKRHQALFHDEEPVMLPRRQDQRQ